MTVKPAAICAIAVLTTACALGTATAGALPSAPLPPARRRCVERG